MSRLRLLQAAEACIGRRAIGVRYAIGDCEHTERGVIEKISEGHMDVYAWINGTPFPFPERVLLESGTYDETLPS